MLIGLTKLMLQQRSRAEQLKGSTLGDGVMIVCNFGVLLSRDLAIPPLELVSMS